MSGLEDTIGTAALVFAAFILAATVRAVYKAVKGRK